MTASPSSLLALLIFCSARSIDHVDDLYPASSFSSVRLVSSWMTVISSCSRSNHCFRKKNQLLLVIVHPLCGSMHVVRPSVVLILVLPRHSSESTDSARIRTYPPFGRDGMSWSRNQFMLISACTSRSSRSRGSSTASGLQGTSHCFCRFILAGPSLLITFPRSSGLVFNWLYCVLVFIRVFVTALSHALWRVLSNKVIWVLGHCSVVSYKLFWNWISVVQFVSQKVRFDTGSHFLHYCLVQILLLWSLSVGVQISRKRRENGMWTLFRDMIFVAHGLSGHGLGGLVPHQYRWAGVVWVACCRDGMMSCADRKKGGASWLQVGLLAQSLPRCRSKRACVCAYVHVVRVCIYMCMYVHVQTCIYVYICMCICMCIRMHVCTCVYVCVCICVLRLWVSVATCWRVVQRRRCACVFVCICMRMQMCVCTYICECLLQWVLRAIWNRCSGH